MFFPRKSVWIIIYIYLMLISIAQAETYKISCPKQIKAVQKLSNTHPGWRSFSNPASSSILDGVSMFTDAPEQQASLKPDDDTTTESRQWHFNATDKTYIVCEYQDTSIQLTQALPAHTTSCTVSFLKNIATAKGRVPDVIRCDK